MSLPWSDQEVELIVADYFDMLADELRGVPVNKTQHRRRLMPLLNGRNHTSIEMKHRNISAVLTELGLPYIKGYKLMTNYQNLLFDKVVDYLTKHIQVENLFALYADAPVNNDPKKIALDTLLTTAPEPTTFVLPKTTIKNRPIKLDYLEREQNNRNLGELGEELVFEYEKWELMRQGKTSLAKSVEWASKTRGDGLGYDILSKNINGTDRYIEVKTTKLGIDAPILFSKGELEFSKNNPKQYYLYRLFNFNATPQLFIKQGSFDSFCNIEAIHFRGIF